MSEDDAKTSTYDPMRRTRERLEVREGLRFAARMFAREGDGCALRDALVHAEAEVTELKRENVRLRARIATLHAEQATKRRKRSR